MSGRSAPRSRNGCSSCRTRKVKCDEHRPTCGQCWTGQLSCEWLPPPKRRRPKPVNPPASAKALAMQSYRLLLPRDMFGFPASQQLANSLHLTSMDREYLVYFPQSAVATWVGKPWKWTFLRYLYSNVASESSVVMRLILAISASELEGRRSMDPGLPDRPSPSNQRVGVAHYGAALREFSTSLERVRDQRRLLSRKALDEIMAAFFFMIAYEQHFGRGRSGLSAHLSGVLAFLETCGVLANQTAELSGNFSKMSKNLLLYIMYIGINHAVLGGERKRGGWLATRDDNVFCDLLDNLFQDSRDTNSIVFGGDYPPEALIDDISVYQPLEFIHECIKLRHLLLSETTGTNLERSNRESARLLSSKVSMMGRRYGNLILVSEAEKPPVSPRELQTIYYSVADYHALNIMCHRFVCIPENKDSRATCHQDSVAKLLAVLEKVKAIDPRPLARISWPFAVAAEMVQSSNDKKWIKDTIKNMQQVTGTSTCYTVLDCI